MQKLSNAEVAALLKESAAATRWAYDQLKMATEKLAHYERLDLARSISNSMDESMRNGLSVEEMTQKLASSNEDLRVLEKAVNLRAHDPKLASVGTEVFTGNHNPSMFQEAPTGHAKEAMINWLLNDSAPPADYTNFF